MIFEDEQAAEQDRVGFVLHLGDFIYEIVRYPEDRPHGMYDRRLRDIVRYRHRGSHQNVEHLGRLGQLARVVGTSYPRHAQRRHIRGFIYTTSDISVAEEEYPGLGFNIARGRRNQGAARTEIDSDAVVRRNPKDYARCRRHSRGPRRFA